MTKEEEVLVAKAILLGYTFVEQPTGYVLCIAPAGGGGWFNNYTDAARALPLDIQECQMRRSHEETMEQIAARSEDYVAGHVTEAVLEASLKALHLDADDVKMYMWRAQVARTHFAKERNK